MSKRLTYKFVKEQFEKEGYTLLSKEYINAKIKLDVKCNKGHEYSVTWDEFKQGNRCPFERYAKTSNTQKFDYKFVKEQFEKEGYTLLSKEYINAHSKLNVKCPKGHEYPVEYNNFKYGNRCPFCSGNKKLTYEFVKEQFEKEGYTLLSKEYINNKSDLITICPLGHEYIISYDTFDQGHRCKFCYYKKLSKGKKLTYEFVKEQIEKTGIILISKIYVSAKEKIHLKCKNNHEYKTTWDSFSHSNGCPICSTYFSKPEKQVLEHVKSLNLDIIIIENDRTQIINPKTNKMLELDIWIPKLKKAIEFNGRYWHNDEYQKYKDKQKVKQCKEKEIELLVIQEQDWIDDKNKCLNKIKDFIKI